MGLERMTQKDSNFLCEGKWGWGRVLVMEEEEDVFYVMEGKKV